MQDLLNNFGFMIFVVLAVTGISTGWLAGAIAGKHRLAFAAAGLIGAELAPVILVALSVGILAAGNAGLVVLTGLIGAAALVLVGQLIFG